MSNVRYSFSIKEKTKATRVTGEKPRITLTYQQLIKDHQESQKRIAMRGFEK